MQFAHARHDRLPGLFIGVNAEGWVFLGEALQSNAHLLLVGFGLWLDSN